MEIRHNTAIRQFELFVENKKIGYLTYLKNQDELELNFVYVSSDQRGKGYAENLVDYAINYIKTNGLKTTISCPVILKICKEKYPEIL